MAKRSKNNIVLKLFVLICIFIIAFSSSSGLLGQVLGFHDYTTYDRGGGGPHVVKVPDAGDAIKIPTEFGQSTDDFEAYHQNWGGVQRKIYDKWVSDGETHSDRHWAYLNVGGKPRYLVALAPIFGVTGDYVDIYITHNGEQKIYPCLIADEKDIWYDPAFTYNGKAYGHVGSNNTCKIIEVCTELAGVASNYSLMTPLLNDMKDITQIVNGGSWLQHPEGPIGLEGPYNYDDGTTSGGESTDGDDEAETFTGALNMFFRNLWDSTATSFENSVNDRNDTSVLYDIKNLSEINSSKAVSGFVQYYQGDYSDVAYGSSNIGNCGCGPTAFAMVASTILHKQITPADAVSWCGNAYYVWGYGTSWSYFSAAKEHFGVPGTMKETGSIDEVVNALKSGALVISSQGPGLFTAHGHFIVLAGIEGDDGIIVKDPNKNNAINKGYNDSKFTKSEINAAAQNYWIFSY